MQLYAQEHARSVTRRCLVLVGLGGPLLQQCSSTPSPLGLCLICIVYVCTYTSRRAHQDLPAVRDLALVYTLAGADCIDVAAEEAVIEAAR